ncbi:MAG: Uma2 family endonuclease [Oscillospiraceae bacterium]|nr:Uma2 family endonuclease [Oscillospiraceae bacterium]
MERYIPKMGMGTTYRHNDIISTFSGDILPLKRKKELIAFHEQCPLVYYGDRGVSAGFKLVDVTAVADVERFLDNIAELQHVKPDFMIFKDNPYLTNKKQTRTAGQPDLIIEVWSESNTDEDIIFLKHLYSTSPITEHWYIEQDSNKVECYIGKKQLAEQYLTNVLKTQKGLEFDLRYLAL